LVDVYSTQWAQWLVKESCYHAADTEGTIIGSIFMPNTIISFLHTDHSEY